MSRISLVSFALLLVISCVAPTWADPLADEMTMMNAQWDAAINNADFDALLPMYTADARLMPPGAQPVTGPMAIRNFFAGRGRSVSNHKLELVDAFSIQNYAYVTSHFTATLVVNEKATPISGSTVRSRMRPICQRRRRPRRPSRTAGRASGTGSMRPRPTAQLAPMASRFTAHSTSTPLICMRASIRIRPPTRSTTPFRGTRSGADGSPAITASAPR
jgi:ketosteroid isomerase-like protein